MVAFTQRNFTFDISTGSIVFVDKGPDYYAFISAKYVRDRKSLIWLELDIQLYVKLLAPVFSF